MKDCYKSLMFSLVIILILSIHFICVSQNENMMETNIPLPSEDLQPRVSLMHAHEKVLNEQTAENKLYEEEKENIPLVYEYSFDEIVPSFERKFSHLSRPHPPNPSYENMKYY